MATILGDRVRGWRMLLIAAKGGYASEQVTYEYIRDCKADCEAEVRRLLKEAGVEVE